MISHLYLFLAVFLLLYRLKLHFPIGYCPFQSEEKKSIVSGARKVLCPKFMPLLLILMFLICQPELIRSKSELFLKYIN